MVLLHIISNDRQQTDEIADLLVKENLALSAVTIQSVSVREKRKNGEVGESDHTLLIARTRGLLFNTIQTRLRDIYPTSMPVIYSIPIVNMDWHEADGLADITTEYE